MATTVILVSPSAPPVGGMTRWTELIGASLKSVDNFQLVFVNSSLGISAQERSVILTIFGTLGCVARGVSALLRNRNTQNCVLHIATSGGKGFLRDYLLCCTANLLNIPTCVHMHFGRIPTILKSRSSERRLLEKVMQSATAIVTMDESSKKALISSGLKSVVNIPNPIDQNEIRTHEVAKEKLIVFVGHVYKEKGIEVLLEAWKQLWPEISDWKLEIIGSCEEIYEEQLTLSVDGMNVSFEGELDHESVLSRILKSRILVLPSYSEGFPNVVLEAMACNAVVVGTEVGAIPEMLNHDKRLLVRPGDSSELAAAIFALIGNEAVMDDLARSMNARVGKLYSLDVVIGELKDLWLSLSRRKGALIG